MPATIRVALVYLNFFRLPEARTPLETVVGVRVSDAKRVGAYAEGAEMLAPTRIGGDSYE